MPRASKQSSGVEIVVAEGTCGDGCGEPVAKGRSFKQGHDAKLRSILGRAHKAGQPVAITSDGHPGELERRGAACGASVAGPGGPGAQGDQAEGTDEAKDGVDQAEDWSQDAGDEGQGVTTPRQPKYEAPGSDRGPQCFSAGPSRRDV